MDQQLFNLARTPAVRELLAESPTAPATASECVAEYGGYATTIFMIGWATGGIIFGILGDRIGRVEDDAADDPALLALHRPERPVGRRSGTSRSIAS